MNLQDRLQAARREILSNNFTIAWWENEKKNEAVLDEVYKDFKQPTILAYPKDMTQEEAINYFTNKHAQLKGR